MSDEIVINITPDPSINISAVDSNEEITLNPLTLNQGLINHSVTHQSGGSDELAHNLLGGLQGGSGNQFYHLTSGEYSNLVTGSVVRPNETGNFITNNQTGQFYANSNPSGFITGVDLSSYATQVYVTGVSGELQNQISNLNNQTGSFYLASNPSGFITGVDLSFSGNYYTKNESESRYVNTTGAETILGDKTFHDKVYINNLYVTGTETIVNTTNANVASNYLILNLTGGAVDGGLFFITGSGLTGINDSGAIIGFDHSDKFKFGIGTRVSDLSTLSTITSFEEVTGISGNLQTQISTLNNQTGDYVLNSETGSFITNFQTGEFYSNLNPSGYITGINNVVFTTGAQTINGNKTFSNNIVGNGTSNVFVNEAGTSPHSLLTQQQLMLGGHRFRQLVHLSGGTVGTLTVEAGPYQVLGTKVSVGNLQSQSAKSNIFDGLYCTDFSTSPMRIIEEIDLFLHGVALQFQANANWVARINFGTSANRIVPYSNQPPTTNLKQWGIEFYYNGTNFVGRLYYYFSSLVYGTPFILPVYTVAERENWVGYIYSIRMRQVPIDINRARLEFYINSSVANVGGTALSKTTPTASLETAAILTQPFRYEGKHINFEVATHTTLIPNGAIRIQCNTMYCQFR